ncbi:hypothetical protein BWQ96_08788 [Gracilariopsis chorda]|uniref:SRR1-like domain-containing protein n=1 Tax=Gracilariopsis chorda TaxID=448386 RepID=A0A2V3IHB3_9FLOR|nr:hypothetical protein BWQ96_08788 [Gracilariopsis chorda]|eukprot:PXF41481.1 hypothetical protein BWQ96_08788 [Gracilariopsis chorda]
MESTKARTTAVHRDTSSDQEWTIVKNTRKRSKKRRSNIAKSAFIPPPPTLPSLSQEALQNLKANFQSTVWWNQTRALLSQAVSEIGHPVQMVYCLGLGSFESSHNARHQLACALSIQEVFNVTNEGCFIGEPCLTPSDELVLHDIGWSRKEWLMHEATWEAKMKNDGCVVMFLPHCPYDLNELVMKWICKNGFAERTVLLANDLSKYCYVVLTRKQHEIKNKINKLHAYGKLHERKCAQAKLSSSETAFNDLCVTVVKQREQEKTVIGLVKEGETSLR